ncbi:MAG: hypothetical protein WC644_04675 [Ignavibacteria bacterium]
MKNFEEYISVFKLKGKDTEDFLQRITTNDLRNLGSKDYKRSIFLNEKGKIVDFVTILKLDTDFTLITTSGNEKNLMEHLKKYIIMEDISINVESVKKQTLISDDYCDFNEIKDFEIIEGNYYFFDKYAFRKIIALIYNNDSIFLKSLYAKCDELNKDSFLNFAIDKAYVFSDNELNENINPLECNLKEFISFNKGCYIGQEVIARLDSQDKVPKVLVKIITDFEISKGDKIYSNISGSETECGFISSAAKSDVNFKGFGFVRDINFNNNFDYYINKNNNNIISINKLT